MSENGIRSRIVRADQRTHFLKMLVYGFPGAGKTFLAGTAVDCADTAPALLLDIEAGTLTVAGKPIDVYRVKTVTDLNEIYEFLRTEDHQYKFVVIDSLTELQKIGMAQIMADARIKDPSKDPDTPTLKEWHKSTEQIRRIVRAFRDLPVHVMFTTHAQEVKDESDGSITLKPSLSGKLAEEVAGFLDVVGYLNVSDKEGVIKRQIVFSPTRKVAIAKDRSGRLPRVLEEPTIEKIFKIVTGKQ